MHDNLYRLKKNLMKELEEIAESGVSSSTLPKIDTLTHSLKNLCKIIKETEEEEGGSYDDRSYDDGGSYRRKRDSMGRYSRAGMADHLRELMESAPDERTREKLRQMIGELDQ